MSFPAFTSEYVSLHEAPQSMPIVSNAFWAAATTLDTFVASAQQNQGFWQMTMRLASASDESKARAAAIMSPRRLLAIVEDWCGDAVNTVPVIQRLVDVNPLLELRVLRRDEHDALMDAHLSGTARAIPVVMVLDEHGNHSGWWGSRPSPLQRWRLLEGSAMEKDARYRATRTWYARDRGRTTVDEVLALIERSVLNKHS